MIPALFPFEIIAVHVHRPSMLQTNPADSRDAMFPITRPTLWKYVKKARTVFWHEDELGLTSDREHFRDRLNDGERRFISYILAFFATADSRVNVNILERFIKEVPYKEAAAFYNMQAAIEDIHNTAYSMLLDELIADNDEKERLFNAANEVPAIGRMTEYITKCAASDEPLQVRMLRMVCAEGILFSGAFCAIYWFRERGLLPGLAQANEFIARDEGLHTLFSIEIYKMMTPALPQADIEVIFREAVDIAVQFTVDALPAGLPRMNAGLMTQYIEYVADTLLVYIGAQTVWGVKNPFGFMEQINMQVRDNFFELRSTSYARVGASTKKTGISRYVTNF